MKILVRSGEHRFFIPIPTAFLLSRPMVKLWLRMMRSAQRDMELPEQAGLAVWNLPEEQVLRLCGEIRRLRKTHPGWTLVEVESAGGDRVEIIV